LPLNKKVNSKISEIISELRALMCVDVQPRANKFHGVIGASGLKNHVSMLLSFI